MPSRCHHGVNLPAAASESRVPSINRPNGTLYIGVTSDLGRRVHEHREGLIAGFTKQYGLKRLVWYEWHDEIEAAIQRETSMKRWYRAYKTRMIMARNPDWNDLYDELS